MKFPPNMWMFSNLLLYNIYNTWPLSRYIAGFSPDPFNPPVSLFCVFCCLFAELWPVWLRSPRSQPERVQCERSHFRRDADPSAHVTECQITQHTPASRVWATAGFFIALFLQPLPQYIPLLSISLYLSAVQVVVCTSLAFHLYYVSFKYLALEFLQGCLRMFVW